MVIVLEFTPEMSTTPTLVGRNIPIPGVAMSQEFGKKVILSSEAGVLVVSSGAGLINVYRFDGTFWLDVLETDAFETNEFALITYPAGFSIAFVYRADSLGFVRIMRFENNRWVTPEEDLGGFPLGSGSLNLASSGIGETLAIGTPGRMVDGLVDAGSIQILRQSQ